MTRRKERRASMEGGKKTILAGESGNEFYLQLANYELNDTGQDVLALFALKTKIKPNEFLSQVCNMKVK